LHPLHRFVRGVNRSFILDMGYLQRRSNALLNAWSGIRKAAADEDHLRIHLSAAVLAIFLCAWFAVTTFQWIFVLLCIVLVISLELVNSAIERLCDLLHPGEHPSIAYVKDVCAAAVLLACIFSVIVGSIIFIPHFINL
jgi:diacylglycerol kinase